MEQFNKQSWQSLMQGIVKILRKQISYDKQYSRNIFNNQESFIEEKTQEFINNFHKFESISAAFQPQKLFEQLISKEIILSKLLFPRKEAVDNKGNVRIKSRTLERLFDVLESRQPVRQVEINYEGIKNIFREQRKLNRSPELFALDNFLRNQNKDSIYKIEDPPQILQKKKLQKKKTIRISLIHSYEDEEALEIIRANISTLNIYKKEYNKMMQSQKVKEVENDSDISKFILEDNIVNSNNCYHFFAFAMQLEYFNNLLQPINLNYYLKNFSIFENNVICRGLILGNLTSLLIRVEEPEFDQEDEEEEYEMDFQDFVQEFNAFFQGYFDQVGNQKQEINILQRNIFNMIYINKKSSNKKQRIREMEKILNEHWGK